VFVLVQDLSHHLSVWRLSVCHTLLLSLSD